MSNELETVATYWKLHEANLAKNLLEADGIRAFLQGQEVIAMDWALTMANNGIKLQVPAEDLEKAIECLSKTAEGDGADDELADENYEEENDADDDTEPSSHSIQSNISEREKIADRAWLATVLGILFFPLQFYVFYLLFWIWINDEPLRGKHLRSAWLATVFNPLIVFGILFLFLH